VSAGELSAQKRCNIVLGPWPAREALWDEEGERRGKRWRGTMERWCAAAPSRLELGKSPSHHWHQIEPLRGDR
jgi:hypothetical protein